MKDNRRIIERLIQDEWATCTVIAVIVIGIILLWIVVLIGCVANDARVEDQWRAVRTQMRLQDAQYEGQLTNKEFTYLSVQAQKWYSGEITAEQYFAFEHRIAQRARKRGSLK